MEKDNQPIASNQTQFSEQAVLYEQSPVVVGDPQTPTKPKKLSNPLVIIITVVALIILIVGLAMIVLPKQSSTTQDELALERSNSGLELSPIQERIQEARLDLEEADPSQEITPFPPIISEIRIIDLKSR